MKRLPSLLDPKAIVRWAEDVVRAWNGHKTEFENLPNIFMTGRNRTGQRAAPSSSSDVLATDAKGDFFYSATYLYVLLDSSGLVWRRVALSSF